MEWRGEEREEGEGFDKIHMRFRQLTVKCNTVITKLLESTNIFKLEDQNKTLIS